MRSITSAVLAATLTGALALGAVSVSAQDQGGQMSGQNGDRRACMQEAMAKLNPPLSDDQKAKIKEAREAHDRGAMEKILTPEQQAQWQEARKACGGGGGGH